MDRSEFRRKFERLGFEVSEEEDSEVLCAENNAEDKIWYSMDVDTQEWCLYFDLDRHSLDDATFDFHEVDFRDDKVVVDPVSGTRPSSGYGVTGFNDTILEVDKHGVNLLERH